MDYQDVISENCINHSQVDWWPRFAFHYTDVNNAVSILSSGFLYSRANAAMFNLMENDNASRQVIDMTSSEIISSVRLYFRPLTPTQYYNEGFKHPLLRYDQDINANVPVPVFFLFDLGKLLSLPGVRFSEKSQAGRGAASYSGVEAFSSLNFDAIYNNRFDDFEATKAFRHAELIYPDAMSIGSCLSWIVCRNSIEKTTLLSLLRKHDLSAYEKYKNRVKIGKSDVFFNNGLFISECAYRNNTLTIVFYNSYACKRYTENMMNKVGISELKPIHVQVLLQWYNSDKFIFQKTIETEVDFLCSKTLTIQGLIPRPEATEIGVFVYFEDKLICYKPQTLESSEILS